MVTDGSALAALLSTNLRALNHQTFLVKFSRSLSAEYLQICARKFETEKNSDPFDKEIKNLL
jgi:hypothetical protein